MRIFKKFFLILFIINFTLVLPACKQLQQVSGAFTNLKRLQFKLENVNNFVLSGINLSSKKSLSDISMTDGIKLTQAFATKKFPAEFVLNVEARNPNDGTGGSAQTSASLTRFDWRLYIDDTQTIAGNISKPIEIPGTGKSTIIPLSISLDLYEFFGNKGYDKIVNLALAIGGVEGSSSKLKLDAKPTVTTSLGDITYPGRITIVNTQFN